MSVLGERHKTVGANGEGLCSVPMWCGGGPAGFCDKPAYGERPDAPTITRWDGHQYRLDCKYAGYVPGLACKGHGGPDKPQEKPHD